MKRITRPGAQKPGSRAPLKQCAQDPTTFTFDNLFYPFERLDSDPFPLSQDWIAVPLEQLLKLDSSCLEQALVLRSQDRIVNYLQPGLPFDFVNLILLQIWTCLKRQIFCKRIKLRAATFCEMYQRLDFFVCTLYSGL